MTISMLLPNDPDKQAEPKVDLTPYYRRDLSPHSKTHSTNHDDKEIQRSLATRQWMSV